MSSLKSSEPPTPWGSYVTLGAPIKVWASHKSSFNTGSFVCCCLLRDRNENKMNFSDFLKNKSYGGQLANSLSFYSIVGNTSKKEPVWVGMTISLFPGNKEQIKRTQGKNKQGDKKNRVAKNERKKLTMGEKEQAKVLWHSVVFYFLEITLFWGKYSLVLFIQADKGREVLMTSAEHNCGCQLDTRMVRQARKKPIVFVG